MKEERGALFFFAIFYNFENLERTGKTTVTRKKNR